jgi:hypothetical protein
MIIIVKEMYGGLRIYEGESRLKATSWALIRPLFWGKKGVDMVVINYRTLTANGSTETETPSEELMKVAKKFQQKVSDQLRGKSQKVMKDWVEKEEYEETR